MKKASLIISCLVATFLLLSVVTREYVASPDWEIYVVDQDGIPSIAVHVAGADPKIEDEYAAVDLTTDAKGHVFVPRRVVRAGRLREWWGAVKQIPLLAHGEVNANGYASVPPPPGYGYPNRGNQVKAVRIGTGRPRMWFRE